MLPLENRWYRRLLVVALLLGVGGGLSSLVFTSATNKGINFFFAGTGTGWWDGNWWWIALTALGGLAVAVLRKLSGKLEIKDSDDRRQVPVRKSVLVSPEFKALWDRIKHKTTYRVQFDNESLLKTCIKAVSYTHLTLPTNREV